MIAKNRSLPLAVFAGGLLLGASIAIGLTMTGVSAQVGLREILGKLLIVLLVLAIPLAHLILMATGAAQAMRRGGRDEMVQRAHVLHSGERIRRVLVLAGGGPHAELGLQLAATITGNGDGA